MAPSVSYILLKLIKQVENRLCADCSKPLAEGSEIHAVINHGTWVCKLCAQSNAELKEGKDPLNNVKSLAQITDPAEIQCMQEAGNNIKRNEVLERYIPRDWVKITPSASTEERNLWIKAKYESFLFTIPQKSQSSALSPAVSPRNRSNSASRPTNGMRKTHLPSRIADYFAVVELKKMVKPPDELIRGKRISFSFVNSFSLFIYSFFHIPVLH